MRRFFNKLSSRLAAGGIVLHALLATLILLLVLPPLAHGYKVQLIQQAEQNAATIAALLKSSPQPILPERITGHGELRHARLVPLAAATPGFDMDQQFGSGGDRLYRIVLPLQLEGEPYRLELGYDESATQRRIGEAYQTALLLLPGYLLLALLINAAIGTRLARPLQQLRETAAKIAGGQAMERIHTLSTITEVKELALDLERMRGKLVAQREDLAMREARVSALMDNVADALVTIDDLGQILSFNLAAERIFGYDAQEVLGESVNTLFAAPLVSRNSGEQPLSIETIAPCETLGRRKDGSTFHMEASISEICELAGCVSIVICRDTSRQKQAELEIKALREDLEQRVVKRTRELASVNKELQHQALHDALTSLPNRVLMQDRLQQATRAAKRDSHSLALMITDLDRFKEINDTLGHHYGDLLLQQVAVRLRSALRDSDTVARLGGDEFAVLLPAIQNEEQAAQAAMKIARTMEAPFILENQSFHVGISIGIALYPKDGDNSAHLMRRADVAMYVAKRAQSSYAFYNPEQDQHSASRLAMAGELRKALEQSELVVHYQPSVDLKRHQVTGVEALLRWNHPSRGELLPDEFIPLAEQTGLIKGLTLFVLNEALQQLHLWQKAGLQLRMAVNLSARNLNDPELVRQLGELLERWQVLPQQLQLEITESAIMEDPNRAMSTLSRLYAMGIKLSIDDFGTGYSSLAYLKQMPVHEIKIDKSFVEGMVVNNEDRVIVRTTIDLAFNMGHRVIAEGVDSREALNMLTGMGCDFAQGFIISQALSGNGLFQWLKSNNEWHSSLKPAAAKPQLEATP